MYFEVRHPRCVSNQSKCDVYTICRQTQLSTRWYADLLNKSQQLHVSATKFGHHQFVNIKENLSIRYTCILCVWGGCMWCRVGEVGARSRKRGGAWL